MGIKTKPIDFVVKKYEQRATTSTDAYRFGIENPKRDWETAVKEAVDTWKQAIQQAIAEGRFEKGVEGKNNEWKQGALNKGVSRYSEGVRSSIDKYKAKMQKVLAIIQAVDLPPRGPRGSEQNYERVKAIGKALHDAKMRGEI